MVTTRAGAILHTTQLDMRIRRAQRHERDALAHAGELIANADDHRADDPRRTTILAWTRRRRFGCGNSDSSSPRSARPSPTPSPPIRRTMSPCRGGSGRWSSRAGSVRAPCCATIGGAAGSASVRSTRRWVPPPWRGSRESGPRSACRRTSAKRRARLRPSGRPRPPRGWRILRHSRAPPYRRG